GGNSLFADDLHLSNGGNLKRESLHLGHHQHDRGMKNDAQRILAGMQVVLHRNAPGAEHVVSLQQFGVVKVNIGEGIQSGKMQVDVASGEGGGVYVEVGLIFPVGQADPLQGFFVIAVKRIGDQFVVQQVRLHQAGNF